MVETRKQKRKLAELEKEQNLAAGDAQVLIKPSKLAKEAEINGKNTRKQKIGLATKAIENVVDKPGNNENEPAEKIKICSDLIELNEINEHQLENMRNKEDNKEGFTSKTIAMVDVGDKIINKKSNNEYRVICKIGHGGFSIVWLVIDLKTKEFKAAKVFKFGHGIKASERDSLVQADNHPNILRYYEYFGLPSKDEHSIAVIYESLGIDLAALLKYGLSVRVIKVIAKNILNALQKIHTRKIGIVHSDIKPANIALSISQKSIYGQIQNILNSEKSLCDYRMSIMKDALFDDVEVKKRITECMPKAPIAEEHDVLKFKLIDFGNAMKSGSNKDTGTYGYCPPEMSFRSDLKSSHDIWSLGVTLFECFTQKNFLSLDPTKNRQENELDCLKKIFGMFPRDLYRNDPCGFKKKFTIEKYDSIKQEKTIKKNLRKKLSCGKRTKEECDEFLGFLLQIFKVIPQERWSADQLLSHPWLNDVL